MSYNRFRKAITIMFKNAFRILSGNTSYKCFMIPMYIEVQLLNDMSWRIYINHIKNMRHGN